MGEFLKNNPILSHFLIPLLIVFMFFLMVGKPYIDRQDIRLQEDIVSGFDSVLYYEKELLKELQNGR